MNIFLARNDWLEKKRRIMVPNFAEIHVIVESEKMVPIGPLPNPTGKVDM